MDALVCVEPGVLRIERRSRPHCDASHVLVRPRRVGICGTDYHILAGKHPYLEYPRVMGHELAVEIVEAPDGSGLEPGEVCAVNPYISCGRCIACQRQKPNCCVRVSVLGVHRDGGLADLQAVPAANLLRVEGLTPDQCALVEPHAIGAHAVRRGTVTREDHVLVIGAGPIGLGVALFARLAGAAVVVLDRDADRASLARSFAGVDAVTAGEGRAGEPGSFSAGDVFDVVFDATGSAQSMEAGFDYVAHGGRYVLVSVVKEPIRFQDPDFHRKELTLLGSRNATSQDFERVIAAIRDGQAPVDRLITHRTSLHGAVYDLPRWTTEKSGLIKAIVALD